MFCPNCGSQVEQGARFCPMCGKTINVASSPTGTVYHTPLQQTPSVSYTDRVRDAVHTVGSSPLFLIATILYTLVQLFSLLSIGGLGSTLSELLSPYLQEMGVSASELRDILNLLNGGSAATALITMLPGILTMTGLWIIYGSSVSRGRNVNTAGYTMIQVITIIQLVFIGLLLLIGLVALLNALSELSSYKYASEDAISTLGVVLVIYIAIAVFIFFYYIKICTTLSTVKDTLITGVPSSNVSSFLAVICFISGAINAITFLNSLSLSSSLDLDIVDDGLMSRLPSLLNVIIPNLFGALILTYKNRMSELEVESVHPPKLYYTHPQPATHTVPTTLYQKADPAPAAAPAATPVVEETPAVEDTPVVEETPAVEEAPAVEDTPAAEEVPAE